MIVPGIIAGFFAWFIVRYFIAGLYTVDQNERAVKTRFGKAVRLADEAALSSPPPIGGSDKERYAYPQLRVISPGGPYFKWPWEKIHKVSIATETVNMAYDPEVKSANEGGTILEA